MARVAGVDLPKSKRLEVALTYIFGIGATRAKVILDKTGIDPNIRVKELTDEQAKKLRECIDTHFKVEGDLRKEISMDVKRLIDIGCYRGLRHRMGLPVRGQRTKTNARTRKGPKPAIGGKKRKAKK